MIKMLWICYQTVFPMTFQLNRQVSQNSAKKMRSRFFIIYSKSKFQKLVSNYQGERKDLTLTRNRISSTHPNCGKYILKETGKKNCRTSVSDPSTGKPFVAMMCRDQRACRNELGDTQRSFTVTTSDKHWSF